MPDTPKHNIYNSDAIARCLAGCTGLKALPDNLAVKGDILGREDLRRPQVRAPHHHGTLEAPQAARLNR